MGNIMFRLAILSGINASDSCKKARHTWPFLFFYPPYFLHRHRAGAVPNWRRLIPFAAVGKPPTGALLAAVWASTNDVAEARATK